MSQCFCHSQDQIKFQTLIFLAILKEIFTCLKKEIVIEVCVKATSIQAGTGLSVELARDSQYMNWYMIYACNSFEV